MDRRKALQNIGTGIGAISLTPSVVSLFQSCQSASNYSPVYFNTSDFKKIWSFSNSSYWNERCSRKSSQSIFKNLKGKKFINNLTK